VPQKDRLTLKALPPAIGVIVHGRLAAAMSAGVTRLFRSTKLAGVNRDCHCRFQ
jgi:hypothetical protein